MEQTRLPEFSWQGGDAAHDIVCHGDVAAAIAASAFESFRRFSRGGLEIGGILLGRRTEAALAVQRWLPIQCEHARGPAFHLSESDEQTLSLRLAEARLSGLEVLGWFVSHSRSSLALSDSDLEVFDRYFPEPWQVALILKPTMDASVRARICSRHASGIAFGPEFRFDTLRAARPQPKHRPAPARKTLPTPEPGIPTRVRRMDSELPSRVVEPPRFLISKPASGSTRWVIVALASLCLLVAAFLFSNSLSMLLPGSAPKLNLRAIDTGERLRVEWNAASPLLQEAQHATVEVNDGGKTTKLLLNTNHLRMGSFDFMRESGDVEFVFTVHRANQPSVQEWTRFIGPPSVDEPAISTPVTGEAGASGRNPLERIRELEEENKRLNAALQEETAKRIRQEQAVRILRQHLR